MSGDSTVVKEEETGFWQDVAREAFEPMRAPLKSVLVKSASLLAKNVKKAIETEVNPMLEVANEWLDEHPDPTERSSGISRWAGNVMDTYTGAFGARTWFGKVITAAIVQCGLAAVSSVIFCTHN